MKVAEQRLDVAGTDDVLEVFKIEELVDDADDAHDSLVKNWSMDDCAVVDIALFCA